MFPDESFATKDSPRREKTYMQATKRQVHNDAPYERSC